MSAGVLETAWDLREAAEWERRAECAKPGVSPRLFFEPDASLRPRDEQGRFNDEAPPVDAYFEPALKVCARCPVREECLEQNVGERYGVWGGLTPRAREVLRRTGQLSLVEGSAVGSARDSIRVSEEAG